MVVGNRGLPFSSRMSLRKITMTRQISLPREKKRHICIQHTPCVNDYRQKLRSILPAFATNTGYRSRTSAPLGQPYTPLCVNILSYIMRRLARYKIIPSTCAPSINSYVIIDLMGRHARPCAKESSHERRTGLLCGVSSHTLSSYIKVSRKNISLG